MTELIDQGLAESQTNVMGNASLLMKQISIPKTPISHQDIVQISPSRDFLFCPSEHAVREFIQISPMLI
jgi:hypothetical protein